MFTKNHIKKGLFILVTFTLIGCQPSNNSVKKESDPTTITDKVIYGADDRKDIYEVSNPLLVNLAKSTVALVKKRDLSLNSVSGNIELKTKVFGTAYGLCPNEPFYNQPLGAFCSGFLVAKNIIVTAGHCIRSQYDCSQTQFVFDYEVRSPSSAAKTSFSADEVYSCAEIIKSEVRSSGGDYAVIRLDRDVNGRAPLSLSSNSPIRNGTPLVVIGHPAGLPKKVAGGAMVRSVEPEHFVANLDTYGGNSGSAVFNATSGDVEGILVRGETDFVYRNGCRSSNQCANSSCDGESVTHISLAKVHLPQLPTSPIDPEEPEPLTDLSYTKYVGQRIPDKNPDGVSSSLLADEAPRGRKVQVEVTIHHSWRGDLQLKLITPSGKHYKLWHRKGGSKDDLVGVFGKDLVSIDDLSALSQEPSSGTWKLIASDHARWDIGQFVRWKLHYTKVPGPKR